MFDSIGIIVLSAVILGLTQAAKLAGLKVKYAPAVAIGLGLVFGLLSLIVTPYYEVVIAGLIAGLTAVGLYSGPKKVVQVIKEAKKSK